MSLSGLGSLRGAAAPPGLRKPGGLRRPGLVGRELCVRVQYSLGPPGYEPHKVFVRVCGPWGNTQSAYFQVFS